MGTGKPTKKSVALAILKADEPSKVLLVYRPEDDEEFPGMWGLPAASLLAGETYRKAALRVGTQKLGTDVRVGKSIGSGSQDRCNYSLKMRLYQAALPRDLPALPDTDRRPGITPEMTMYVSWRWGAAWELEEAARRGSLCSRLLLESPVLG